MRFRNKKRQAIAIGMSAALSAVLISARSISARNTQPATTEVSEKDTADSRTDLDYDSPAQPGEEAYRKQYRPSILREQARLEALRRGEQVEPEPGQPRDTQQAGQVARGSRFTNDRANY